MRRMLIIWVILLAAVSCRERYDPPLISSKNSFLVVEANLNPQGLTSILVTKTVPLGSGSASNISPVLNAQITVEGRDNSVRQLSSIGNGRYNNSNLGLTIGSEYRLHIKTNDGKEYLSDYVNARKTPVIDSIVYELEAAGLRIQAHAHDVTKQTRYYRWDFDETWESRSYFPSTVIYDPNIRNIRDRIFPDEDVAVCWKYETSAGIVLANSARLSDDIIYKAPVQLIPNGNEKLAVRYSILLRQYALDKEAYNFYELMKKNTEDLGNLFSPQPSEVRGNIRSIKDDKEFVLGYLTVSTVEEQRKFIQVPWNFSLNCNPFSVSEFLIDSIRKYFASGENIPYEHNKPDHLYRGAEAQCVDCTKRGGSTKKPSYW